MEVRDLVLKTLEEARAAGTIGAPLEAAVTVRAAGPSYLLLEAEAANLPAYFITSEVRVEKADGPNGVAVSVARAEGEKCGRCWQRSRTVGEDASRAELCRRCRAVLTALNA